ncbi:hypothetical protein BKA61DRAFT_739848 [Leptodontidium sp. MPI-SDFR-AT-0119]|nr:hypothetical protein BKA61DRAFT_739848 [Leptodontidium sp. MPI-SDFR-AT-0119]
MMWGLDDLLDDVSRADGSFGDVGDDIRTAFAAAIKKCDDYMEIVKNNDMYFAAYVLDPRVKLTNIREQFGDDTDAIILRIQKYLKKEYLKPGVVNVEVRPQPPLPPGANVHAIGLLQRAHRNRDAPTAYNIDKYLDSDPVDWDIADSSNYHLNWILNWWKANSFIYLLMASVARDLLAVLGSEVDVERLFCGGRDLLGIRRLHMSGETIRMVTLLKAWFERLLKDGAVVLPELPPRFRPMEDQGEVHALSDATPYNVPLPGSSASGAMGSAGGLMTTTNDLSKYYKALLRLWTRDAYPGSGSTTQDGAVQVFPEISWLFTPLQIMGSPTIREKSYAGGWARSQLPGTVGDIGVNPGFVDQMPLLAQGSDSRLAFWHQGSLVGDTSFVMLLPETESAVVVLTNSMALNDAADWIGQLLVEILLDSSTSNDYIHLATVSAKRAIEKFNELSRTMEADSTGSKPPRDLGKYTGSYVGVGGLFLIDIVLVEGSLEMRLQGRKCQAFRLRHQHDDVFSWFLPFDEQIKRGLFIEYKPEHYLIRFQSGDETGFRCLNWAHDGDVEAGDDFRRIDDASTTS